MTEAKKKYLERPEEAAVHLVAALITAGKIGYDIDAIVEAHQKLTEALSRPPRDPMRINPEALKI
ncbi:hypothetical protein [Azotobacter beijerinckii]|uniref:Uncharacterized protein n=1 Tax=Azotobacter beijerinckii TaxID=170623 RepID=A0A1I0Z288_9GAMM|nr:hypothetical protein [Azotobacter beijerinckii]SFB19725.1 hypothetical protein SAMN04244571_01750 [Azotobacter beijerinckii]